MVQVQSNDKTAEIKIESGGGQGTAKWIYANLWTADSRPIMCDRYELDQGTMELSSRRLVVGEWYYISVDHRYNPSYPGSFTLCIDDGSAPGDAIRIGGKVLNGTRSPWSGETVTLLDDDEQPIKSIATDKEGQFKFDFLAPGQNYFVRIEKWNDGLITGVLQTNAKNQVIKKTVRHADNIYGFVDLPTNCGFITLVDCDDLHLTIDAGKFGILGKIVHKNDRLNGVADMDVHLYSSPDNIVASTKTDPGGEFNFNNVPFNEKHMIKIGRPDPQIYAEMLVINDEGIAVRSATSRNMDKNGFFKFEELPPMAPSSVDLQASDDTEMQIETDFSDLSVGNTVTLNNVYFLSGQYTLLPTSYTAIDRLLAILRDNPKMHISITGHTDSQGSAKLNLKLSEQRAKSVYDHLVSQGIAGTRLGHKGYGGTKPVASNNTVSGRRANRRVDLKVVNN